jgi:peptidoglycan/LPS O-acetylase OafA/YrhL
MIQADIPMQSENGQRFHIPELDGLRFIAFLLVFIHNANPILKGTFLETFSAYSWFGVDLFFCLSAFLITKLLVTEYRQMGKINIRNFYIRRILRIGPLYFFYIIVGMIIMAPMEGRNINIPGHLASLATFTFNIGYFALLPSPILIFIHLWSISFEEQFYVVIPWLVRRLSQVREKWSWTHIGIAYLIGSLIRALFIHYQFRHPAIYFLPVTHFDSMIGGVILGLGLLDDLFEHFQEKFLLLTGVLCLSALFLLPNNDVIGWGLMLTYPLIGLGMSLIVFSVTRQNHDRFSKLISNNVFIYLGKISYGLYIFHFSAFILIVTMLSNWLGLQQLEYPKYTIPVLLGGITLTVVFSVISYNLLEKPFLKWKERFSLISSHPS